MQVASILCRKRIGFSESSWEVGAFGITDAQPGRLAMRGKRLGTLLESYQMRWPMILLAGIDTGELHALQEAAILPR